MAIGVGLRIGSVVSTAVVASNEPGTPDPVVIARDTVLHIDHDETPALGGSARHLDEAAVVIVGLERFSHPPARCAAHEARYHAVHAELAERPRDVDPLPAHVLAQDARAVQLTGMQLGHGEGLVEGGVEGDGDDHSG